MAYAECISSIIRATVDDNQAKFEGLDPAEARRMRADEIARLEENILTLTDEAEKRLAKTLNDATKLGQALSEDQLMQMRQEAYSAEARSAKERYYQRLQYQAELVSNIAKGNALKDTLLVRGATSVHEMQPAAAEIVRQVESQGHANTSQLKSILYTGLKKIGVDAKLGFMDIEVAKEWMYLQDPDRALRDGYTAKTDSVAYKIAQVVKTVVDESHAMLTRAGAHIPYSMEHLLKTTHDYMKMSAVGFETWWESTAPRLDERTFSNMEAALEERKTAEINKAVDDAVREHRKGISDAKKANPDWRNDKGLSSAQKAEQATARRIDEKTAEDKVRKDAHDRLTSSPEFAAKYDDPEAQRTEFGRILYNEILSSIHAQANGGTRIQEPGRIPDYNGGKGAKYARSRTLIWKDSDAWVAHMREFGQSPDLGMALHTTMEMSGRDAALMDRFGTRHRDTLQSVYKQIEQTLTESGVDGRSFKLIQHRINAMIDQLDGKAGQSADSQVSKFCAPIREWMAGSRLGAVSWTHLAGVFPTMASEYHSQGMSWGESIAATVHGLMRGEDAATRNEFLAGHEGAERSFRNSVLWGAEGIPGKASSIASTAVNATGVHLLFDKAMTSAKYTLSNNLATLAGKEFSELHPQTQRRLGEAGIGKKEWDLLRSTDPHISETGLKYRTAASVYTGLKGKLDEVKAAMQPVYETPELAAAGKQEKLNRAANYYRNTLDQADIEAMRGTPDINELSADQVRSSLTTDQKSALDASIKSKGIDLSKDEGKAAFSAMDAQKLIADGHLSPAMQAQVIAAMKESNLSAALDVKAAEHIKARDTRMAEEYARQISDRLSGYLHAAAERSIVTPDAVMRSYTNWGAPGTVAGEARAFFMQFKSWPVQAMMQMYDQNVYRAANKGEILGNLLALGAIGATSGTAVYYAKKGLHGQEMPPLSPAVVLAGLGHSGVLGLFGDYIFGQLGEDKSAADRTSELMSAAVGPVMSELFTATPRIMAALADIPDKGPHKFEAELENFTEHNIPFIHTWYTYQLYNYMLGNTLHEWRTPGWMQKTNRARAQEGEQPLSTYLKGS